MEEDTTTNKSNTISSQIPSLSKDGKLVHMRALFNYTPLEDLYIPCKELGLSFSKGDILHVIRRNTDADWWQAYKDDDKEQSLAALIPSQSFQEKYVLIYLATFICDVSIQFIIQTTNKKEIGTNANSYR
jgi:hypothetical protein